MMPPPESQVESLAQRIFSRIHHLGEGLIHAGCFLNHRVDTGLMTEIGEEFARQLERRGIVDVSLVVTAETSGIAPALVTAQALGVPMVFARKQRPSTMVGECYSISVPSHTKGKLVELSICADYLSAVDRVVFVDDFLGSGETARAMLKLLAQSGCHVGALGFVLEKVYEKGRETLAEVSIPIITLAQLDLMEKHLVLCAVDD